jgi:hypothetical protein
MDVDKKRKEPTSTPPGTDKPKKLKKAMIDQNLETCDKKTLFYQYPIII